MNMKKTKDNSELASLIDSLSKEKKPIWKRVMSEISRPRRDRVEVNLSKIERFADSGSTVLVPGTVLGSGNLTKKDVTIAALRFSGSAKKLISQSGGKMTSIEALVKANPEGKSVVLLK
jgi:large subunit ribosomal protein L18e